MISALNFANAVALSILSPMAEFLVLLTLILALLATALLCGVLIVGLVRAILGLSGEPQTTEDPGP